MDYIHLYIIGHCNSSVRVINPVSHSTYVVCVNFIYKWRDLLFKVVSEQEIFEKLFYFRFNYSLSRFLPEIC